MHQNMDIPDPWNTFPVPVNPGSPSRRLLLTSISLFLATGPGLASSRLRMPSAWIRDVPMEVHLLESGLMMDVSFKSTTVSHPHPSFSQLTSGSVAAATFRRVGGRVGDGPRRGSLSGERQRNLGYVPATNWCLALSGKVKYW